MIKRLFLATCVAGALAAGCNEPDPQENNSIGAATVTQQSLAAVPNKPHDVRVQKTLSENRFAEKTRRPTLAPRPKRMPASEQAAFFTKLRQRTTAPGQDHATP